MRLYFLNPCNKCLVNPICYKTCQKRFDFYTTRSRSTPFLLIIVSLALAILLNRITSNTLFITIGAVIIGLFTSWVAHIFWIRLKPYKENDPSFRHYGIRFKP